MSQTTLLYPVFVQVLLTFVVMVLMGRARRLSLMRSRTPVDSPEVARATHKWSDEAVKAANNFSNQFELPVLFYAGVVVALLSKQSDLTIHVLAWGFAVSRLVHAGIHIGPNVVRFRFLAYLIGGLCLLGLWGTLAWRVLSGVAVV